MRPGVVGATARAMRPTRAGVHGPVTGAHVCPAFNERKCPFGEPEAWGKKGSPMPAYTWVGSAGLTARSVASPLRVRFQLLPLSIDQYTPDGVRLGGNTSDGSRPISARVVAASKFELDGCGLMAL